MLTLRGKARKGGVIELENDVQLDDGEEVLVTLLNKESVSSWTASDRIHALDGDKYCVPTTERGREPDRLLRELRDNDRL